MASPLPLIITTESLFCFLTVILHACSYDDCESPLPLIITTESLFCFLTVNLHVCSCVDNDCDSSHTQNDEELDFKHQYEDEAEESDNDFIDDDDEVDESSSDAQIEARAAIRGLRNRQTWKETHLTCALCQDMRVVFRHLLGLE